MALVAWPVTLAASRAPIKNGWPLNVPLTELNEGVPTKLPPSVFSVTESVPSLAPMTYSCGKPVSVTLLSNACAIAGCAQYH